MFPTAVPAPSGTWKLPFLKHLSRVIACVPPISEKYVFCRERTRFACLFDRRCHSFTQNKIVAAILPLAKAGDPQLLPLTVS